jgi:uncharacterized protein YbjT (DUF2867 family)
VTIAMIGATGQVGTPLVRTLLDRGSHVRLLVRDGAKAERLFGSRSDRLQVVEGSLADGDQVAAAFADADVGFVALGPTGSEGELQASVLRSVGGSGLPHLVRLSVLATSPTSLGMNQRGHAALDEVVAATGIGYTSLRPAVFTTGLLAQRSAIRDRNELLGSSTHGRNALIDPGDVADVAAAVLTDPALWHRHHVLTGARLSLWSEVADALSTVLGRPVRFRALPPEELRAAIVELSGSADLAEMVVARESAVEAGENETLTSTVAELTGHPPRTLEESLSTFASAFVPS